MEGFSLRRMLEVFTNSYGVYGVRETVLGAAKLGLEHVELAMSSESAPASDPLLVIGERTSPAHIAELKSIAEENGIRFVSAFGHADLRLSTGVDVLKQQVEVGADLGVRFFTVSAPEKSREVYDHLLELADYALRRGVLICLETHPPLVSDARVALQTMNDLKHSNIRINFDTANPYYYNEKIDIVAELDKMVEYVAHVHLKESRKRFEDWYFPALGEGEGCIDFPAIFRVLDRAGFRGPFSLELEGIRGEERSLELYHGRVERSIAYLREIGVM